MIRNISSKDLAFDKFLCDSWSFLIIQDFHEEYAKVAFKKYDPEGTGHISSMDFHDILVNIKSHLLTPEVKANLIAVARGSSNASSKVSYAYFVAFISLLNNMELIKKIYLQATGNNYELEVTKIFLSSIFEWDFQY